ncbi:MAG: phage holin family protein [Cyanophyceae cyanobacterium]
MAFLIPFLIGVVITAVSLLIISKLPFGVEIDSPQKALLGGVVLGILNGIAQAVPGILTILPKILTLGLFSLIVNMIFFGLTAWLIEGFRLRWGIWSALLGAVSLAIINSLLFKILSLVPGLG